MLPTIQATLKELVELLHDLSDEMYTHPVVKLSGSTIGQHTRHIIEFFQCLTNEYDSGCINYDARQRNKIIETSASAAVKSLQAIQSEINKENKPLKVHYILNGEEIRLESNYSRELMYNLEHCIHHQALIKVAILQYPNIHVSKSFGVAPCTSAFRKTIAPLT